LQYGLCVDKEKRDVLSEKELELLGFKGKSNFLKKYGWIDFQKCECYHNWMLIENNFNINEFYTYFNTLIKSMLHKIENLKK
jgi:hypothetical protein